MKILVWTKWIDDIYLGTKPPDGIGGAEVQLAYWSKVFVDSGHSVFTFGWRKASLFKSIYGVRFFFIPWVRKIGVLFNPLRFLYLLISRPDLVVLRSSDDFIKLQKLKSTLGYKLVYMLASDKNVETESGTYRDWQLNLKFADLVVAQNEYQESRLQVDLDVKNILLQKNIFLPELFHIEPVNIRSIDFIWLGNLKKLKRPEWFVKLSKSLPEYSFVMAGKVQEAYYESSEFLETIAGLPNLVFKGFVSLEDSIKLMSESKILVNTSEYEGYPNTFIQAEEFGCGIVATVNPNYILDSKDQCHYVKSIEDCIKFCDSLISSWHYDEKIKNKDSYNETSDFVKLINRF